MNDYEIHVFNIAWLEEEQIRMFKSDFRIVAEFFRDKRLGRLDSQKEEFEVGNYGRRGKSKSEVQG